MFRFGCVYASHFIVPCNYIIGMRGGGRWLSYEVNSTENRVWFDFDALRSGSNISEWRKGENMAIMFETPMRFYVSGN